MHKYRKGKWIKNDSQTLQTWIKNTLDKSKLKQKEKKERIFHPVVQSFKDLIDKNADLKHYFDDMFQEVSSQHKQQMTVQSFEDALLVLNHIITEEPPEFDKHSGLVGCPISVIFNWPESTKQGLRCFLDKRVNNAIKDILNAWEEFLKSPQSCKYLNTHGPTGWFCNDALKEMPNFVETFQCNPNHSHWGFTSWDHFFLRQFRRGVRPVEAQDDDSVINNACESSPENLVSNIHEVEPFWIKGHLYSLCHIFQDERHHKQFVGGTLYQGYLSPFNYHRWHSPVNGKIVRCWTIPGTYFSEAPYVDNDEAAPNESQAYISEVATRAIILIEANNPHIGLMAFVAVGMGEVSTCQITVQEGQIVRKGEEIGMFRFGGSSHLLIFRPETKIYFSYFGDNIPGLDSQVIHVNKKIAKVRNYLPGEEDDHNEGEKEEAHESSEQKGLSEKK